MYRFKGKRVLVTGAASGIGRATALRFTAEGAVLGLCDLNHESLTAVGSETGLALGELFMRTVDVADGEALERFVVDAGQALGGIDILVNNAGIGCFGHIDEITPDQWRRVFAVDVDAIFYASRAALPFLRTSTGCIVNTASISGLFGDPGLAAYCAAKGSVVNLTRQLAVDHAPEGIRVNCVCPGGTSSPMLRSHLRDAAFVDEYARTVPMGRVGTPEEMAAGITFLASSDASYITGTELTIDGGVTAQTGQPHFDRLYRERGWDQRIFRQTRSEGGS
ncbi:MAG: SDR family oxidoreductase [Acidimicrobiales bacterium]|nr:SDR family oxidoreductase [Acidimicrobiales bacterium]